MSRTTDYGQVLAVAAALFAALPGQSQTLGELADAQRLKQRAEMAKLQREAQADAVPAAGTSKAAQVVATTPAATPMQTGPRFVVHALYARDGVWIAEVAEGQRLSLALPGMKLGAAKVAAVEQRGIVLTKPCTAQDVREKAACGKRVVGVGGEI